MTSKFVALFAASFAVFAFFAVSARAQGDDKAAVMQRVDAGRDHYATVAKEIWGFAEVG